ncbi:unnamed protein product [Pedinophyceae sp. YPF-701]|nr:unnamed protein product [Pedinophyceae sp. YPF-701]
MIKGTDRGADVEVTKRAAIDNILEELELRGQQQMPRPLDNNPLLWGNYEVAYTSAGPAQNGAPAGGRFRGPLGRLLFRTRGLYQSVFEPSDPSDPPTAVNKVEFSLLGFLPGWAGLRGKVEPEGAGNMDTVKVTFAPARVNLFGLEMVLGKPSSVVLQTVYLDERVRLGRGSRGSLFVFRRGGAAESAGMETLGTGAGVPGRMVLGAITLALLCAGLALVVGVPPGSSGWAGKVAGAALLAVTGLCGAVLRRGGQENDPDAGSALNQEEMEMAEQMAAVADAGAEARAG